MKRCSVSLLKMMALGNMSPLVINSKGKVVGPGKVAISHDSSIQNVMLVESLGYNLLSVSRLADFGLNVVFTEVDCKCFVETIIKWSLPVYVEVIFTLSISLKRHNL